MLATSKNSKTHNVLLCNLLYVEALYYTENMLCLSIVCYDIVECPLMGYCAYLEGTQSHITIFWILADSLDKMSLL